MCLAGHVMVEEAEGEPPMTPSPIMQYSISQTKSTDIQATLGVLASPSKGQAGDGGQSEAADPVVR